MTLKIISLSATCISSHYKLLVSEPVIGFHESEDAVAALEKALVVRSTQAGDSIDIGGRECIFEMVEHAQDMLSGQEVYMRG